MGDPFTFSQLPPPSDLERAEIKLGVPGRGRGQGTMRAGSWALEKARPREAEPGGKQD